MAILAPTIWRVRPGGSSLNGAGYDGTTYAGGTDYSQQDTAQASGSLGTAAGTTTFTDAGGAFTSAMVGNGLRIASGAGFTVGYYFITAFGSSTSITLDRSPGTGTVAVWKVGGAAGGSTYMPFSIADSARATGDKAVPGNTIYILGSSATPVSPDYSYANGFLNPQVAGDSTNGPIKFMVDPSQPTWRPFISNSGGDLFIANGANFATFDGLILRATSAGNGRMFDAALGWKFRNCTFNLNDIATNAVNCNNPPALFLNTEFFSKTSGAPTARSTNFAININGGPIVSGCSFHDLGPISIGASSGGNFHGPIVLDSVFNNCVQPYLLWNATGGFLNNSLVRGCTFNKNTQDAIQITTGEALAGLVFLDNIISNNTGVGKFGVNISGTLATNDRIKGMLDYNDFFNNTVDVNGYTKGSNDIALDPQYTSASSPFDLTLNGTNLQGQAFPRAAIEGG